MEIKIAILRGINVGGRRKILMAELKQVCLALGLTDVITYIQSGNIIFKTDYSNQEVEQNLEKSILDIFNLDVPVIVRSRTEFLQAIENNPFNIPDADVNALHLTFLKENPSAAQLEGMAQVEVAADEFHIQGKDVFIRCAGKYHQTKLTNGLFEKKLKVGATTRNWKTVLKLKELADSLA